MRATKPHIRLPADAFRSAPVVELATLLSVPPTIAFYHWTRMLCWVAEHQPDGNVSQLTPEELASAAGWPVASAPRFGSAYLSACTDNGAVLEWDGIGQAVRRAAAKRDDQSKRNDENRKGNWIEPYHTAWREAYGGNMAVEKNAHDLKKLEAEHGADEVLRRWKLMLKRTKPEFAGAYRLVQAWGTFGEGATDGMTKRQRAATAMYDLLLKHGILTMSQSMQRIEQLEQAGTIKSAARFVELLRKCDRDTLKNARTPGYAITHIEERCGDLLDG